MAVEGPSLFDSGSNGEDRIGRIADAVANLPVEPRRRRWTSLSACVLDAIWSIGSHYDRIVAPLVRSVLEPGATGPLLSETVLTVDSHPLPRFLSRFPDEQSLLVAAGNRQRTSTRGGVTKAEAALRYARILVDNGVLELADVARVAASPEHSSRIDRALSRVPGEGQHGIRRSYFWMLCGDEDRIKPDRMVMRWLAPFGVRDPSSAQQVLTEVAELLTDRADPGAPRVTPWQLDHAIWLATRERGRS